MLTHTQSSLVFKVIHITVLACVLMLFFLNAFGESVSAVRGTRLGDCVQMEDESQRSMCLYQLNAAANEECAGEANLSECVHTYISGTSNPSDNPPAEPQRQARNTCQTWADCPLLERYIKPFISMLSGAVGIVIVIMIVYGGIRYTSSRDNPQETAQAKSHIYNALIALVFYIFSVAFLNWLVPGGVLL